MSIRLFKFLLIFVALVLPSCISTGDDLVSQAIKSPTQSVDIAKSTNPFDIVKTSGRSFYDVRTYNTFSHRISRNAAVRVQIDYGFTLIYGSGTYFKWKNQTMVITAAHLFALGGDSVFNSEAFITTPHERVLGRLVYIDKQVDIAIFAVPELPSRRPATFNRADSYEIGESTVYSGFPGANNLLTFHGTMAGEGYGTDIAMHSFAWPGSSGSGVFNEKGEFVGVVTAIMVGGGPGGRQLVGSVVYVAPASLIDSRYLLNNLRRLKEGKNEGF